MDSPINILILEDAEIRIDAFKTILAHHRPVICKDVESAKEAYLQRESWDLLLLDHDLGGEIYVDPLEPNTGTQFVRWLMQQVRPPRCRVIIHSHNHQAAQGMESDLTRADWSVARQPFGADMWHLVTLILLTIQREATQA